MIKHLCQKPTKINEEYHIRPCKACAENKVIRKRREDFEDMTKTTIAWDDYDVLV